MHVSYIVRVHVVSVTSTFTNDKKNDVSKIYYVHIHTYRKLTFFSATKPVIPSLSRASLTAAFQDCNFLPFFALALLTISNTNSNVNKELQSNIVPIK